MDPMHAIAIIADDHTGAADSGIHFARAGRRTLLLLDPAELAAGLPGPGAVALSTESRFLGPEQADRKVRAVVGQCRRAGITRFFKKIDSTMRGNPGSEIAAALEATDSEAALLCTAIPEAGRSCVDGVILLDGRPLHTTAFGRDPFHPLATSTIADLLARQCDFRTGRLGLDDLRGAAPDLAGKAQALLADGCRLLIADAATANDLDALAALLRGLPRLLPVGAAGLAAALARGLPGAGPATHAKHLPAGRILAVVGSLAGISRDQADLACAAGKYTPLDLDPRAAGEDLDAECARLVTEAAGHGAGHLLLRTRSESRPQSASGAEGERVAGFLGRAAREIFRETACDILFATGGNTATAVARSMGIRSVILCEELMPGVILGSCTVPGLGPRRFITKAGGFGGETLLLDLALRFAPHP